MTDDQTTRLPDGFDDLLRSAVADAAPMTYSPSDTRQRGRARQLRRRTAGAAVALVLVGSVATVALALPEGGSSNVVVSDPTSSPTPTTEPTASTGTPAPSPHLELRGDDLGVTRLGDTKDRAITAVSKVLGTADLRDSFTSCPGSYSEVSWHATAHGWDLLLSFDKNGRVDGWSVSTPRLSTPSGVRVGTTVAQLRAIYHDRLTVYPPEFDHGDTYTVAGVDMLGELSGRTTTDRVVSLENGTCTGP